ncbi:MAG TPA: hypothetical protein VJQ82_23105 [Terriglobales bacterium]|nr:hypothetical protein [Terriglobales bacterium]
MKVTFVALFLILSASLAFGQAVAATSALSAQPVVIQMPGHPQHASYAPMAQERGLMEKSAYSFAHGERPLWELAPVREEVPLGDIARALREEHLKAPKAQFIREN